MSPFTNALLKLWLNCMHSLDGENLPTSKETVRPAVANISIMFTSYRYLQEISIIIHDYRNFFTVYPIPPVMM